MQAFETSSASLSCLAAGADEAVLTARFIARTWPRASWGEGVVFLPNRRSAALLAEAMRREGMTSVPRLIPLAEAALDEGKGDEGAMLPLKRRWLLALQVRRFLEAGGQPCSMRYALAMADTLGALLDECERHDVLNADFRALAPAAFASHWQRTLAFLSIILSHWPQLEAESGEVSQAAKQHRGLLVLARRWRETPPAHPVLMAGSTASQPATAALAEAIARAPQGHVLLPGVFTGISAEEAQRIAPGHPLYYPQALALRCGSSLHALSIEGADSESETARRFIAAAFGAMEAPVDTLALPAQHHAVLCEDEWHEARVVALLIREQLAMPQRTVMLASPDRGLLSRVRIILERWEINADSSSATTLAEHPFIVWARRALALVAAQAAPLDMLAFLQHPLSFAGQEEVRAFFVRYLDGKMAREVVLSRGLREMERHLLAPDMPPEMQEHAVRLRDALRVLQECHSARADMQGWRDALMRAGACMGAESACDEAAQEALEAMVAPFDGERFGAQECALCLTHAADTPWFAGGGDFHPRLMLHTPIEARMAQADCIILSGLNEGVWPALSANPWLNRAMLAALGLPGAEHQYSLAAHDFVSLASRPELYYTRAQRLRGAATSPSRFWQRLELTAARLGATLATPRAQALALAARKLDAPHSYRPAPPPKPVPPVALRPHGLRATEMADLVLNPYALYARHVLALRDLGQIDPPPEAALFGTLAHRALEQAHAQRGSLSPDIQARIVQQVLAPYRDLPASELFWKGRLLRILAFFAREDALRAPALEEVLAEQRLELTLEAPSGALRIRGTADRIERAQDGSLTIADYKTSSRLPSFKALECGEAPQLPLYAAALRRSSGEGAAALSVSYWGLPNGQKPGEVKTWPLAEETLQRLLAGYGALAEYTLFQPTPMLYCPHGARAYPQYDTLARAGEWGGVEAG